MIVFTINGNDYKCKEHLSEMTLQTAIDLHTLCTEKMPGKLALIYKTLSEAEEENFEAFNEVYSTITEEDSIKTFPKFYGDVIALLTDCPKDVISKINSDERTGFYKTLLEKLVLSILYQPISYQPKEITHFIHEGVKYLTPESKTVIGQKRPLFSNTALEFTECADLLLASKGLAGGKFENAAMILGILCRPEGENGKMVEYIEDEAVKRSEIFKTLPMTTVFDVFFCLNLAITISRQSMTISSLVEVAKQQSQLQVQE